ncbi:hypothetical protein NKH77_49800 [Streptomyces sp. M19]
MRHLEAATVDDALDLLHALMATKLLAKAERMGNDTKLKALPQLRKAAKKVAAVVPDTDGDDDAEWRAELVARYGTVRGFIRLLVEVIDFGAVEAGAPVVKALKRLPKLIGR